MTVRGSYLKLNWKIWLFIVPDKIAFLTTKSGFRLGQLNCFQRHSNSLSITWLVNSLFFTQKLHRSYSIDLFFIALILLVCQMLATTSENNWFCKQNNSSVCASRFLVHFFDVHCKPLHIRDTKSPGATFYGGRERTYDDDFPVPLWTWILRTDTTPAFFKLTVSKLTR